MTSLTLATILYLPLLATPAETADAETYADAHRKTAETGQPMVVMVGAEWCPACKQMETAVLPQVRQGGFLRRVAFALVDLDRERELGQKLIAGGPIPQLIIFRRTTTGWARNRLIGGQTVQTVEDFITQEVKTNDETGKPAADTVKKQEPKKDSADGKVTTAKAQIRPVSAN